MSEIGFIKFDLLGYDCDLVLTADRAGEEIVVTRYDRGKYLSSEKYTLSAQELVYIFLKNESK